MDSSEQRSQSQHNLIVFDGDPHGCKSHLRVEYGSSISQSKFPAMPGTSQNRFVLRPEVFAARRGKAGALDSTSTDRSALVWATIEDREEPVFEVEDTDLLAPDVHNLRCAVRDTFNGSDDVFFQDSVPNEGRP